jgi:glycosyltransferase involved in cell wall biosynthesis
LKDLDISVVVLCYQQHWTARLALTALRAQRFDGIWEVIVADDGSSADTVARLLPLLDELDVPARVVWQQHRGNREQRARNNAIQLARGRSLLFLDGDTVPSRELVARHAAEQASGPALVAGARRWVNREMDLAGFPEPDATALERLTRLERSADPITSRREERETEIRARLHSSAYPWRVCYACHLSVPWSPELRFDETLTGWGPSDMELAARLVERHGYPVRYLQDLVAWHVETGGLSSNVFRRGRHEEIVRYMQNTFAFLARHPDPVLEAEETAAWGRFMLDDQDRWFVVAWQQQRNPQEAVEEARRWLARHAPIAGSRSPPRTVPQRGPADNQT